MSETVTAAIIGLGGAVIVAICGVVTQVLITRKVIQAERDKVLLSIETEDVRRRDARKKDLIIEALSELIAVTDPDTRKTSSHEQTARLICRLQLLLDRRIPLEAELNGALNRLGHDVGGNAELIGIHPTGFQLHGEVIDLGAAVIRSLPNQYQ